MTNLNGGTLFNAEFGIRHGAAPYRKGQVLHSVFAAAMHNRAFDITPHRSIQACCFLLLNSLVCRLPFGVLCVRATSIFHAGITTSSHLGSVLLEGAKA